MSYKKLITHLSFLLAVLLGHAGMAVAAHTVSISDFSIKAGEEKTIEVNFTSEATDIYYVSGTITMPEGLEVVVTNGMAQVATTSRTTGFSINMNVSTGLFRVTSLTKQHITGTSGAIATIKVKASDVLAETSTITLSDFTVKHDVEGNTSEAATTQNATVTREQDEPVVSGPIAFSPATLSLNAGESVTVDVTMDYDVALVDFEAKITASEGLTIDVTGADSWNPTRGKIGIDAIAAHAGTIFTVSVTAAADFSGEGTITLKNIVAYDESDNDYDFDEITLIIAPPEEPDTETATFAFDFTGDIDMIPGETVEVPVTLTNGCALSGFQATLALPSGVSVEIVKSDRLASAPSYRETTGNITYLGGITGRDGVLFTLKLTAGNDLADGTLTLSNLKATTASSHSITADPASISLNVTKGTDNIVFAFSETEIELAAGESVDVDVILTNDRARSGFQATLTLPTGITATLTKSDRLAANPSYRETTGNITYLGGIEGNDGVLFTITLTATDEFVADGQVTLTNLKTTTASSVSSSADDIVLDVKTAGYVLDETSSEAIVAGTYSRVTLKRSFIAGWNTVCLPFAVSNLTEFFGEGAKAYEFTSYANNNLNFNTVSALESGKPYVVYVATAFSEKVVNNVDVVAEPVTVSNSNAKFIGTFAPIAAPNMVGKYGLTSEARIAKGGSGASIDGFRAYFELPEAARVIFNDNSSTGISAIEADGTQQNVYNLNGQKVEKTHKGLLIIGGKKVVVR